MSEINGARLTSQIQNQVQNLAKSKQQDVNSSLNSGILIDVTQCQSQIDQLFNSEDLLNKPTDVLLEYEEHFCHAQSDQFQKAVIPYYCFYSGLNLLNQISVTKDRQQTINNFCSSFGSGYQERKRFLSKLQLETNEVSFMEKCTYNYDNSYDQSLTKFDSLDMSGLLDSAYYCESLYKMIKALKPHHRDSLPDLIRYSYILSLQSFIETNEANDYGACEEYSAKKDTFCLDFFDWKTKFSLWTQQQSQVICGKVNLHAKNSTNIISDMCAYTITRVYGMYDQYLNKILDNILTKEINALNMELDHAIQEANQHEIDSKANLDKISKWLDELKVQSDVEQKQKNEVMLKERLREIDLEKAQNEKAMEKVLQFIDSLKSQEEIFEMQANEDKIRETLQSLRKEQEEIMNQTQPDQFRIVNEMLDKFIEDYYNGKKESAFEDMQKAIELRDTEDKVSEFLKELLKTKQQDSDSTNQLGSDNQTFNTDSQKIVQTDDLEVNKDQSTVKSSYTDVEKVSNFLDSVVSKLPSTDQQTSSKKTKKSKKNSNKINETVSQLETSESTNAQNTLQKTLKVLQFIDDLLMSEATNISKDKVSEFVDQVYKNHKLDRTSTQSKEDSDKSNKTKKNKSKTPKKDKVDEISSLINKNSDNNEVSKLVNQASNIIQEENSTIINQHSIQHSDKVTEVSHNNSSVEDKLGKVMTFIDNLFAQEKFNEKLLKVQQFIDQIIANKNNQKKQEKADKFLEDIDSDEEEDSNNDEDEYEEEYEEEEDEQQDKNVKSESKQTNSVSDNKKTDEDIKKVQDMLKNIENQDETDNQIKKVNDFLDSLVAMDSKSKKVTDGKDKEGYVQKSSDNGNSEIKNLIKEEEDESDEDDDEEYYEEEELEEDEEEVDEDDEQKVDNKNEKIEEDQDVNEDEDDEEITDQDDYDDEEQEDEEIEEDEEEEDVNDIEEETPQSDKQSSTSSTINNQLTSISDINDLKAYLDTQIDQAHNSIERQKLTQLKDILDKYNINEKKTKVTNFIDSLLKQNQASKLQKVKLEASDVTTFLNQYEKNLAQIGKQSKTQVQIKSIVSNKSSSSSHNKLKSQIKNQHDIANKDATDLEKKKNELDRLFTKLCNERAQDFNNILFSVRPLEHQLNELSSYVDGLQKSSKVLKDELLSQTNLFTFRQLEFKSLYYQELIEGLQVFEKIERMIEEVEFLSQQQNLIQASISFQNLKKFVFSNEPNVQLGIEVKSMLQEFGMLEMIKKRISEKQRILQDQINSNLLDLLFARSKESCSKKLQQIMKFFEAKFQKLDSNESILEYICQDFTDLKKIQDQFQKIHTKENDSASKAQSLIDQHLMTNDEAITMGLLCLQKDYEKAIQDQNVAYLVILINAYKRVSQDPIQEYLRNQLDNQIQGLVQRLIEVLSQNMKPQKKFYSYQQNSISDAISELLQIDCQNLKKVALLVQSIFLFFQQNLSFFMLIDKQEVTTIVESGISLDYVNIFFYYFKFLIQILFDHDRKIKEFNLKNGISEDIQPQQNLAKKLNVEKNMRFSFRNKEEMESFLVDSVRLKLDFYKTMEEMMVPILFKQNISFVMTLGSRMICMIDGVVDQVDLNFSKDSQNKQQIQAFKGWMKRFIVTNYEIFLDHYKQHCDFVAQKYFNKTFDAQNLVKIGIQDEKVLVGSSQKLSQSMMFGAEIKESMQFSRASIIGRINQSQIDHNSMWSVFEYIKSFSYVSQLAVERIPLEDKNKQDQAMFRQEILESVNKTMKKVYEKMIQVVNICFTGSHKDAFFSAQTYSNEKDSYFFKGLIKQEEVKSNSKQKASKDSIEEQEFLYKPKLAMQNELLSNSMSTLTLLMQIYHRMSDQAIKEFSACYQYISSQKLWEQLLSEKVKKDFNRNQESIQNINYDILVFLRCEFTTRAFSHLREMTRIDFTGTASSSSRLEPFAQSLIRDFKILQNFVSQYLGQVEIFYLFATLQKQVFRLYGHYVRFIKRQEIDEFGFQRLKKTLFQLKVEFDLIVPKMLGEGSQSNTKRFVDEMRQDIAREYEKTIYILQLIVCDEEEIEYKIQENDYGLTEQDFEALENIQKSYSSNMYSQNEEQQQIHDKDQKLDQIQ